MSKESTPSSVSSVISSGSSHSPNSTDLNIHDTLSNSESNSAVSESTLVDESFNLPDDISEHLSDMEEDNIGNIDTVSGSEIGDSDKMSEELLQPRITNQKIDSSQTGAKQIKSKSSCESQGVDEVLGEGSGENSAKKVDKDEVKSWVKAGILVHGPVPKDERNFRSSVYTTGGIKFLYWKEDGDEFLNWFGCEHCNWIGYCLPAKGTSGLSKHAKIHAKDLPLEIKKRELAELLASAMDFGFKNGTANAPRIELLLPNKWSKFESSKFFHDLKAFVNVDDGSPKEAESKTSKQHIAIERARASLATQNSTSKGN